MPSKNHEGYVILVEYLAFTQVEPSCEGWCLIEDAVRELATEQEEMTCLQPYTLIAQAFFNL